MINSITISGRLTRDAVMRTAKNGNPYATFTLAVTDTYNTKKVYFINCIAFGKTATNIEQFTMKGLRLIVRGSLQTRDYTRKDGAKATAYEVAVDEAEFIDFKDREEQEEYVEEEWDEDEWDGGLF